MTTLVPATGSLARRTGVFRFTRHFIEMVVAMIIGMAALGALWGVVFSASGTDFDPSRTTTSSSSRSRWRST